MRSEGRVARRKILGERTGDGKQKMALDRPPGRAYSSHPVAVLKGIVTGAGSAGSSGNARPEDNGESGF
jgi:hypothetical protein